MNDVFISYTRTDRVFAKRLLNNLHAVGRDTWIDWQNIPFAANWWAEICAGIENADNFVAIISPSYMQSPLCQIELAHARNYAKRIIPIIFERVHFEEGLAYFESFTPNTQISDMLDGRNLFTLARANWEYIERYNWIYFTEDQNFDTDFKNLMHVINTDLDYVKAHTRLLERAKEWVHSGYHHGLLLNTYEIEQVKHWLEQDSKAAPEPNDLQFQYFEASVYQQNKISNVIRHYTRSFATRLLRLGPRKVFISYRRADSAQISGRIYDRLYPVFGRKNVFLDVDTIDFGVNFQNFINLTLLDCFAMLVIIGPNWVSILNERRQEGTEDYVRIEVETALKSKQIHVVPVFVDKAEPPSEGDLPQGMRQLPSMNGTVIGTGRDFHPHMDILTNKLKRLR